MIHNISMDNIDAALKGQWWLHCESHPFPPMVRIIPVLCLAWLCSHFPGWGSSSSVNSDLISGYLFLKFLKHLSCLHIRLQMGTIFFEFLHFLMILLLTHLPWRNEHIHR